MCGVCWGVQGRPKDGPEDKFRLTPVVPRLQELLGGAKARLIFRLNTKQID
jgi:3-phosphoglycerate kinase